MNARERTAVMQCLTDMMQVLQPDAVSAVVDSLSFQQTVTSCKDAVESLRAPGSSTGSSVYLSRQQRSSRGSLSDVMRC